MTKLPSYSANNEDVILHRIFGQQEHGFYIDVGAAHPLMENDTKALYDRGWTGINVEPNPSLFPELQQGRPRDRNLQLALSDTAGELDFHEVVGTGLSTLDPAEAERCAANGHRVVTHRVRTSTLADMLAEQPPQVIDLLKIDVEGFEEQVLAGNDWKRFRPRIIQVEATYPETPHRRETGIEALLAGHGYRRAHFDGLNDFYVEEGFHGADGAFELPPNVFDGFVSYQIADLHRHAAALEVQLVNSQQQHETAQAERDALKLELAEAHRGAAEHAEAAAANAAAREREIASLTGTAREAGVARDNFRLDADRLRVSVTALTAQADVFSREIEAAHMTAEELVLARAELPHLQLMLRDMTWRHGTERAGRLAIEGSTSWRMTRPIRRALNAMRAARRASAD